jgi:hypothetical protein
MFYQQFSIYVKSLISPDLHPPHPLTRTHSIFERWFEFVAPRTPPAVAVAIVVAAQELAATAAIFLHGEGHVDGFEELFAERGGYFAEELDIVGCFGGGKPAQEVPRCC